MGEPRDEDRLDGQRLKAIAHPLRARVLAVLRTDGPATASGLAQRFTTNTGQTSYHLRVLADAGLVEEVEERGTARERWWSAVHRTTWIEVRDVTDDPGTMERRRWLRSEAAANQDRAYAEYLDQADDFSPEWGRAAGTWAWRLPLTPRALEELQREIAQVVLRYVDRRPQPSADASRPAAVEPVHVHLRAFPGREVDRS